MAAVDLHPHGFFSIHRIFKTCFIFVYLLALSKCPGPAATRAKTGKTTVLPGFWEIDCNYGSGSKTVMWPLLWRPWFRHLAFTMGVTGGSVPGLSIRGIFNFALSYSYLSNKRDVTLTDFEKFHPLQKKSPLHISWFLRFFFHPPLRVYCIYVLVFSKKFHPPR